MDMKFLNEVINHGGKDLKKCMQCSECTVVCPLSPIENPFPRKEMLWGQWGLKDKILTDPDIWMCHNCEDCSRLCPRDAKPGSVLGSLRSVAVQNYSWPGFVSKTFSKKRFLPLFVLFPIVLMVLFYFAAGLTIPGNGTIYFSSLFSYDYVDTIGLIVGFYALFVLLFGAWRYYRAFTREKRGDMGFFRAALKTVWEVLFHKWFSKCESNHRRYYAHLMIFFGFSLLLIATLMGALEIHLFGFTHLLIGDPQNIVGNIGLVVILSGLIIAMVSRLISKVPKEDTYFDWYLVLVLFLIVCTGILMEAFRLGGSSVAYWVYMSHLILVFMLLAYAPYSKFAHFVYRFIAMTYLTSIGRKPSVQ